MARASAREGSGQMTVELAVLTPVVIVVALIVFNLVRFMSLCASFDRISLDAVVSHGIAPAGEQSRAAAVDEVRACIEQAMGSDLVEVEVVARDVDARADTRDGQELKFPVSPLFTSFSCTLSYHPWPRIGSLAGVSLGTPVTLVHERTLVVDRFRAGVVV